MAPFLQTGERANLHRESSTQDPEQASSRTSLDTLHDSRPHTATSTTGLTNQPSSDEKKPNNQPLPLRQRMRHFTWAWYTTSMSTSGLSLLLYAQPHQFPGLRQIGLAVYILNILLFSAITAGLATRFWLFPGSLRASLTHPREGFFFPTAFLAVATLITSTDRYAVPDQSRELIWAVQLTFWAYVVGSSILAVVQYTLVFASRHRMDPFGGMMPTWLLPIFPVMLSGTIASVIADTQPDISAVPIVVAGLTCQGLGLAVAGMMYALMAGRLFSAGLPHREHRPGLFMCVGPPAFTALALVGMAAGLPEDLDVNLDGVVDVGMLQTLALVAGVFLWALSFWWFGIAAMAVVMAPPKYFHLGWWAAVFPNVGFTLATIALGNAMRCDAILGVATGMSVALVVVYLFVFYHQVRAVLVRDIMSPGKDEDVEDH